LGERGFAPHEGALPLDPISAMYISTIRREYHGNVSITTDKIGELPKESKSGLTKR